MMYVTSTDPPELVLGGVVEKYWLQKCLKWLNSRFLAVFGSFRKFSRPSTTILVVWAFGMMHVTSTDPPELVLGGVVGKYWL